jgi:hypothetical protein
VTSVIADIGAGSGYFTFRLAHHVGEMRIDRDDLMKEMETNGFHLEAEHTFLPPLHIIIPEIGILVRHAILVV